MKIERGSKNSNRLYLSIECGARRSKRRWYRAMHSKQRCVIKCSFCSRWRKFRNMERVALIEIHARFRNLNGEKKIVDDSDARCCVRYTQLYIISGQGAFFGKIIYLGTCVAPKKNQPKMNRPVSSQGPTGCDRKVSWTQPRNHFSREIRFPILRSKILIFYLS